MADNQENTDEQENTRVEYAALSNFYSSTVGFRLTLLGFYLAAIGFMLQGISDEKPFLPLAISLVGLLLTISMYIFELRTRVLYTQLGKRGIQIEQDNWNIGNRQNHNPFFSRLFPEYVPPKDKSIKNNETIDKDNYGISIKMFGFIPVRRVSHSFALDLLYWGLAIFFAYSLGGAILSPKVSTYRNNNCKHANRYVSCANIYSNAYS